MFDSDMQIIFLIFSVLTFLYIFLFKNIKFIFIKNIILFQQSAFFIINSFKNSFFYLFYYYKIFYAMLIILHLLIFFELYSFWYSVFIIIAVWINFWIFLHYIYNFSFSELTIWKNNYLLSSTFSIFKSFYNFVVQFE